MLQEYAGTVLQLNNKILWPGIFLFEHIITFKYITNSYQKCPPSMKVLGLPAKYSVWHCSEDIRLVNI